jgi:serine/threonine-protein kinase HipA
MDKCDVLIWDKKFGELSYMDNKLIFIYTTKTPFEISPLHLNSAQILYDYTHLVQQRSLPGVLNDSLPDLYGEKALSSYFSSIHKDADTIDKLLFIGDKTMGAITYAPQQNDKKAKRQTLELNNIYDEIKKAINTKFVDMELSLEILKSVSPVGGAKPKALIGYKDDNSPIFVGGRNEPLPKGYHHSIIKLCTQEQGATSNDLKVEYIYMTLAKKAGINIPEIVLTPQNHYVIRRFDRDESERLHMHTLQGLLHSDFLTPRTVDYVEAFRVMIALKCPKEDFRQLYKRMVFNYLFRNHDDHEKNISFLMNRKGDWNLSPAYDLTYAYKLGGRFIGDHQLTFNGNTGDEATLETFKDIAKIAEVSDYQKIINSIEHIRDTDLEDMLKRYKVETEFASLILSNTQKRSLHV